MSRYILKRLLQILISLFVLTIVIFLLARVAGNPVDLLLPAGATPEQRQEMISQMGLDRPYIVQYREFITDVLKGDLGTSIRFGQSTVSLYGQRFLNTLWLVLPVVPLMFIVGLFLGVLAATRRGTLYDWGARLLATLGLAAPPFWVSLMLVFIFAVWLRWLPVGRMGGVDHYVLPVLSNLLFVFPGIARLLRSSMLEVLDTEYIKLARAKGLSERVVIWKHALRNALIPILSFSGMILSMLLTASIVTEIIFAWPGVGRLLYDAIFYRDYPLLQGCVIITAIIVLGTNLIVDVLYAYVDPRIRYGKM